MRWRKGEVEVVDGQGVVACLVGCRARYQRAQQHTRAPVGPNTSNRNSNLTWQPSLPPPQPSSSVSLHMQSSTPAPSHTCPSPHPSPLAPLAAIELLSAAAPLARSSRRSLLLDRPRAQTLLVRPACRAHHSKPAHSLSHGIPSLQFGLLSSCLYPLCPVPSHRRLTTPSFPRGHFRPLIAHSRARNRRDASAAPAVDQSSAPADACHARTRLARRRVNDAGRRSAADNKDCCERQSESARRTGDAGPRTMTQVGGRARRGQARRGCQAAWCRARAGS